MLRPIVALSCRRWKRKGRRVRHGPGHESFMSGHQASTSRHKALVRLSFPGMAGPLCLMTRRVQLRRGRICATSGHASVARRPMHPVGQTRERLPATHPLRSPPHEPRPRTRPPHGRIPPPHARTGASHGRTRGAEDRTRPRARRTGGREWWTRPPHARTDGASAGRTASRPPRGEPVPGTSEPRGEPQAGH